MAQLALIVSALFLVSDVSGGRQVRYVEWSPPVVHPQQDHVTIQARQNYTLSCEGHKPVSWHLPMSVTNRDIANRYNT